MGRPINNRNFGSGVGKLAVKFYDGSSVVTGFIVKQLGSNKYLVSKNDGSGQKACRLVQDAAELALLTSGTAAPNAPFGTTREGLCTIEAAIVGGSTENVKKVLGETRIQTITGTKAASMKRNAGNTDFVTSATAGDANPVGVADLTLSVANAIADKVATVAAAFSFVVPANTFSGGNMPITLSMNTVAGFTFNAATRTVSKAAGASSVGTKTIIITATDADGDTITDSFDVVVS